MESKDIINGSKLIAEYLGWVYIPFSTDLKHKAGWWSKVPKTDEDRFFSKVNGDDGFVCRKHSDLRFYNSFDAIIPVIEKIEKEDNVSFYLNNGGCVAGYGDLSLEVCNSFDIELTWIQNTFNVVVKYLENGRISRN